MWPQVRALSWPTPCPLLLPTQVEDLQRSPTREGVTGGSDCEGMCVLSRLTKHHPQKAGGIPFPCGDHPTSLQQPLSLYPRPPWSCFLGTERFCCCLLESHLAPLAPKGTDFWPAGRRVAFLPERSGTLLGRAASAEPGILHFPRLLSGRTLALAQTLSLQRAGRGGLQHRHVLGPSCMVRSPTGVCGAALGLVSPRQLGPPSATQQDC